MPLLNNLDTQLLEKNMDTLIAHHLRHQFRCKTCPSEERTGTSSRRERRAKRESWKRKSRERKSCERRCSWKRKSCERRCSWKRKSWQRKG
ncbi:unnamed protein product [Arctogadus glacialis]